MRVPVTRIDPRLPLPRRSTIGSAGYDLYARLEVTIEPGAVASIPANVIVGVPPGHVLIVALRSSTPRRTGLICPHGIGIIDSDYCGPEDEVQVQVFNPTDRAVTVERGERIAQAFVLPIPPIEWEEGIPDTPSRGGFGSTGFT